MTTCPRCGYEEPLTMALRPLMMTSLSRYRDDFGDSLYSRLMKHFQMLGDVVAYADKHRGLKGFEKLPLFGPATIAHLDEAFSHIGIDLTRTSGGPWSPADYDREALRTLKGHDESYAYEHRKKRAA